MRHRWLQFAALFFASLVIGLNMFKVSPIMDLLSESFQIGIPDVAWLISVFTLAGIVLSIPSAQLLARTDAKKTGIIFLLFLVAGSLIGGFAPSYPVLLVSRILEGVSFVGFLFLGIVLIAHWFKPRERGLPTGLFLAFASLAQIIAFALVPPIVLAASWRTLWHLGTVLAVVALVIFAVVIRVPKPAGEAGTRESSAGALIQAFQNSKTLLAAGLICLAAFILYTYLNLYPRFFVDLYGVQPEQANVYSSMLGLFSIVFLVVLGFVISKINNAKLVILVAGICMTAAVLATFYLSPGLYIFHTLSIALVTCALNPAIFSLPAVVAKKPSLVGYTVGIVNCLYFVGAFLSAPVLTTAAARGGDWSATKTPLAVVVALIVVLAVIFFVIDRNSKGRNGEKSVKKR